jgi:glutamate synthase (ferredoxin)
MASGERGVDFITVDGGEGGTGAGPLAFTDHVAQPFKIGFSQVFNIFSEHDLDKRVVFAGSGKLGFPSDGLFAFGLGCDLINVGREAMLAIGCIQAQRCHTGHCPAGVATQNKWLMRGLEPTSKAARLANYIITMRKELLQLSYAIGVEHPGDVTLDDFDVIDDTLHRLPASKVFSRESVY